MLPARHVLCAVGPWTSFSEVDRAVAVYGGPAFLREDDYSALEHDPGIREAFAASACRVHPSMTDGDLDRIDEHRAVAFVLSPPLDPGSALGVSARVLAVVGALLDAGATGVKDESAGIAHSAAQWHSYAEAAARGDRLALRDALVRRPLSDGPWLYSCGMHLLGHPDVEVEPGDDALGWLDAATAALLAGPLGAGDAVELGGRRRLLEAVPCTRYEPDDLFVNPHGYLRLRPPQGRGLLRRRRA